MINLTKIALNFEGSTIRLLTYQKDVVIDWMDTNLPSEVMSLGQIHQPDLVGEALHQLFEAKDSPKRRVITCAAGHRAVHRLLTVPKMKRRMLAEAVHRKAKQEFALPLEDTDLIWQVISDEGFETRVFVLAFPKILIDQQMKALALAKIRPRSMDAKSLALTRAVNQPDCIITNLETHSMSVLIVQAGIPVIVRTVPLDSGESSDEAKVDLLSQELARTTKFYNESNKQNQLAADLSVYVSGEVFEFPGLLDRLSDRSTYPLKTIDPPLTIPDELPIAKYAVNLGLALKR